MRKQHLVIRHRFISVLATTTIASLACSGGRPSLSTGAQGSGSSSLTIHLSAGTPIAGATITVYAIHDADGRVNTAVGDAGVIGTGGPTDSSGDATVTLSMQDYSGPLQIVASGSNLSYVDPCSAASSDPAGVAIQIPADFTLSSLIPNYVAGTTLTLPVTILTTLADHEALAYVQGRHPLHPGTTTLSAALADRDRLFVQHITSSASAWDPASFRTTVPAALGDGPQTLNESALAALFDVALSSLAHRIAEQAGYDEGSTVINAVTVAQLLEQDLDADATFDGKGAGGAQVRTSGSSPVSIDAQTLRLPLASALDEFIYTPAVNKSGITRIDLSNAGVYDSITNDESDLFGAPPAGTFALDRIPPSVAFATPIPAATNAALTVQVRVTDTGAGFSSVWAQLNGTEPVEATATGSAGVYETLPLTLAPGPNTIVAWAVDNAQTSGQGQPSPATATANVIFDNSRPDPSYVAQLASYYDERGLSVATSGNVAVVPVQYVCSTAVNGCNKTAIPADRGISKVATRLGWAAQPTAAVLEGANPDNIPLLRWRVPYSSATDAPITKATYSVAVSCTGCSYPAAAGDLWRSAATSTEGVLFELPVASNLIPALASLPRTATLAVTATFTDAAGNAATNTVSVPFHLLGPPLAVVPDSSYLRCCSGYRPKGGWYLSYETVANGMYVSMWGTTNRSVYHYTVSNPYSQSVAINFPTATWTNKETWKARRRKFTQWFKPPDHFASAGACQIPANENELGSPCTRNGQSDFAFPSLPSCATDGGCPYSGYGCATRILANTHYDYLSAPACSEPRYPTQGCVAAVDPLRDWGTISAGTSPAYSKFYFGDHELSVKPNTGDYVIPGASAGSPAVVDVELFVSAITRLPRQYPWTSPGFAPPLPAQSCFGNGLGTGSYFTYATGQNRRKDCDGTSILETTAYYDYQYPEEIHDDISGSWSITPKPLDAAFNEIGDPAPQRVLGLNYQIPHN
jgi:hypothetical protein